MSSKIRKRDLLFGLSAAAFSSWLFAEKHTKSADKIIFDERVREDEQDKQVAISQVEAQVANNSSSDFTTMGFTNLAKKYPWLNGVKRTVGLVIVGNPASLYGSAVLLDQQGTIALCAHEYKDQIAELRFYLSPNSIVGTAVNNFCYDETHDLMFATIDPSFIEQYGLSPVQWGDMSYSRDETDRNIISVGYPTVSFRLHATEGKVLAFEDKVLLLDGTQKACKMESDNVAFSGMSGGGVFSYQKFVGINSSANEPGIYRRLDFTPVDFIKAAYVGLYPDRAAAAGVTMPDQTSDSSVVPDSCQFNTRAFLSALMPKPS